MKLPTLTLAALLLATAPAQAADTNALLPGEMLRDACELRGPETDGMCLGYVVGAWEAATMALDAIYACPPPGANRAQATDAVRAFLRAHPDVVTKPAVVIVPAAIMAAWPCGDPA